MDKALTRCYHCHGVGHIAQNCPLQGRSEPAEAPGRQGAGNGRLSKKVATLVADKDQPEKAKTSQQRWWVEDLQRELQEAEMEESIADVSATIHVLNADHSHKSTLGPTLTVQVNFEGVPMKALVDTGSPVTIVSFDFCAHLLKSI